MFPRWSGSSSQEKAPAALLLLLLFVTACQAGGVADAAIDGLAQVPPLVGTRPAGDDLASTPPELPSFRLVSPDELAATSAAGPTAAPPTIPPPETQTATASPTFVPTPTDTPTATPPPTFTPPALPLTSPDEHYWLRRPVADGGVVWTDKSYPYGTTKGGAYRPHHGVEFNVPSGTEILAAASGIVRVAGRDNLVAHGPSTDFYGRLVLIELDTRIDGLPVFNLYGHLSEVLVETGQHVQAQEVIALSGASGVADGPHLHFEVRVGQNSYEATRNPLLWLYPFPDRGTVAGRVVWPNGDLVHEAPIRLRRVDAVSRYAATTTYADQGVNPDEGWNENFAFDDVEAGFYDVIVDTGEVEFARKVWVFPYRTSYVEIVLDAALQPVEQ